METYIFHEGELPPEIKEDFEPAIFNTLSFCRLQDPLHWQSYYLVDQRKRIAVAGIHFHISDGVASSPYRAPFGSVDCCEKINPAYLYRFLEYIQAQLKQQGVSGIHIKNPPGIYFPDRASLLHVFFANLNFAVADSEIAAVIPVGDEPFTAGIRHSERLRIRQTQKADFTFRLLPMEKAGEVYQFISACHVEKGYKLSITMADLQKTVTQFPDRCVLSGVYHDQRMVAASVSIRIYRNILYNFLVNHEKQYNSLSPALLLMEGIHRYCKENSIALFDLGTSALEGKPNFPLLDFKMHIGGRPSSKVTFFKKLN